MPAPPAPGWVYVLTNPAMPGLVKIGLTTKTPKARAVELTAATGGADAVQGGMALQVCGCVHPFM